jgi:hypothetical protein
MEAREMHLEAGEDRLFNINGILENAAISPSGIATYTLVASTDIRGGGRLSDSSSISLHGLEILFAGYSS